jgi:hypothetical protein
MGAYYVGLDVHSRDSAFVIQDEGGTIVSRGVIPTTPEGFMRLRDEHPLPAGTIVALETGTSAFYVARLLAGLQLEPVVIDAREVRRKRRAPRRRVTAVMLWSSATGFGGASIGPSSIFRPRPSARSARLCPAGATSSASKGPRSTRPSGCSAEPAGPAGRG